MTRTGTSCRSDWNDPPSRLCRCLSEQAIIGFSLWFAADHERDAYFLTGERAYRCVTDALAAEAEARREAGFEVELIGPAKVERRYGTRRRHAIVGFGNYSADPRRMAASYLRVGQGRDALIYAPLRGHRRRTWRASRRVRY
ncbi:hypothetical protein [Sphingopyxis terrae]|uniref:hypothetical protein n=1 Tax=Sphingopyxis terrae TaxID=33052 RepID=UPI00105694B2|nr:hypothetical protein [Sphingopyxis terrae]